MLFLGTRPVIDRLAAMAVGIVNAACAADGVVTALVADLTTLGTIVLLVLSVAVACVGALQVHAARR